MLGDSFETGPDSLDEWMNRYRTLALEGVRSQAVEQKIALHLRRFCEFFQARYGHDRVSACVQRDVLAWRSWLAERFAASTTNNHLASLSGFTTWLHSHNPSLFPMGDPAKGIGEVPLPALEPRALNDDQVASLKNLCDRLETFYRLKVSQHRQTAEPAPLHTHARPKRDRAIVFVLLSTGLRREELVRVDLDQVEPNTPHELRQARQARIRRVQGKGKTERTVFLSADARRP